MQCEVIEVSCKYEKILLLPGNGAITCSLKRGSIKEQSDLDYLVKYSRGLLMEQIKKDWHSAELKDDLEFG